MGYELLLRVLKYLKLVINDLKYTLNDKIGLKSVWNWLYILKICFKWRKIGFKILKIRY